MNELQRLGNDLVERHGVRGGALRLAALIALAWTAFGAVLVLAGMTMGVGLPGGQRTPVAEAIVSIGGLVVAGSAAALVTYPLVAWQLGAWAARSGSMLGPVVTIAFAEVVVNAAAIAPIFGLIGLFGGPAGAALFVVIAFVGGLIIFGLPGLAIALPSSYVLVRLLRDAAQPTAV